MFCTKCGNEIKDGYKFCPKCGTPAFVENEEPKGEVKKDVDEVTKETNAFVDSEPVKTPEQIKKTSKTNIASNTQKEETDSTAHDIYTPNPLIEKELDLLRVRKKAEQGNKNAMLRQAFRYEMGIGVEKDTAKAEELYEKAGGKTALSLLERSHINCILPDPNYDYALLSTDETNDDKDNVLRVLPFVKDIILDYANKVEQYKSQGKFTEEKSIDYRNEFIQRMKVVRDLHPELLLANIDEKVTEEDVNRLFDAIKESASSRYSLKWIPSLYNFSDSVDGNRFDIPSIYEIKANGLFIINFLDEKEKINLLYQFIYTLLLQLPIKKIRLTFVDLEKKYEYEKLLRQLNPIIYYDKPITTEDQLDVLLKRLEERQLDVLKKYGNYPEFCDNNKEIPLPYEFVFFFNDTCPAEYEDRLLKLYGSSCQMGIFFVHFNGKSSITIKNGDIYNSIKNELYSKTNRSYDFINKNGVYFTPIYSKEESNEIYCDLILQVPGSSLLTIVKIVKECLGVDLKTAKDLVDEAPSVLGECIPLSKAKEIQEKLEMNGAISVISIIETNNDTIFNWNNLFPMQDNNNEKGYYLEGYGNYEVVLNLLKYPEFHRYDIDAIMDYVNKFCIFSESFIDEKLTLPNIINDGIIVKAFPTKEEGEIFINRQKTPKVSYNNDNRIRLLPYFVRGKIKDQLAIALYVPKNICYSYENFKQDLSFYLTKIGFQPTISQHFIDVVCSKIRIEYNNYQYFPDSRKESRSISLEKETISYINFGGYDGFLFPDFFATRYKLDFGFWGFNEDNSEKVQNAYDTIKLCEQDIFSIEKELDDYAKKKWGKEYDKKHLAFKDTIDNVAYLEVRKTKRYRIPILQYNNYGSDSLVKPINFVEDDFFNQACINYINSEAVSKEETKIVSLDYDASSSYENIATELMIDVGKKGKDEMIFRMDLVSHVHSFIIGQSGSGKSVFLHNIIGGAMLKYAPEDLQLYLLDFKLGGVEFNRYKGAKHVKALLVDNSDPQVTLEILRELRNSMTERGKLLRSAGVNNIGEYNKQHQQDRMPHVLVVADECHEMFKADDSIPRQVRNEISDIVIKIAKEGRSQGVHLVFATQTLSGTEISSEIINNVSDFYLLKCAQTDSERLVPNSSAITSELSTGQIYYHHVDEQMKFQAYYTDKETAEKLMAAIVEKAKDHKSNGEFYFNGAQMFYLDESVKEQMLAVKGKSPVAFMGKAIDISQKDLYIKLNEDFSENVLLLGLNDQEQVTRTTMNLFVSLMMSAKLKHKDIAFKVIDCLNNEEGEVHELIFDLENEGYCEIIERRQRSKFFKELAQGVQDGTAEETILLILGQDRFRELKMDMELEEDNSSKSSDNDDMMSISDDFFGGGDSSSSNIRTYREALNVILEKGPDYGVHTLLQIEKASNLLFEDYITPKVVFQKFKHLVMLKSDETAGVTLHLNDDIRLEKLSSDWERLRAYYYAEESDSYTLFTPYMPSKSKDIINLLKTI